MSPPLKGEVVQPVSAQTLQALEDLAQLWEQGAESLERQGLAAALNGGSLGDFALGLVSGAASQVRADTLRDAARQLREVLAEPGVFTHKEFKQFQNSKSACTCVRRGFGNFPGGHRPGGCVED